MPSAPPPTRGWRSSTSTAGPSGSCRPARASTTQPAPSTRWTRCAATASPAARCWPRGACSAATRGVTAGSITSRTRDCSDDHRVAAQPARGHPPPRPRLAPRLRRPLLGLVDRGADGDRAAPARAADGPPDPLDAEPPAACAADEGDPEEVQERQEAPAGGADALLPGEPDQPGRVVPAASRAVPGLHLALPGSASFLEAPAGRSVRRCAWRLLVARPQLRSGHHRSRERALERLR